MCYRCFKPTPACVCADVRVVDNRTGVIIVQHPRERNHPFGTARFAQLGLRRVRIQVCGPNDAEEMARVCALPPNTALLYPSADACEVADLPPGERPDHIVLVDATWHHAHSLLRSAPWLRALPRIRVQPSIPSQYRVRREPRAECLSTIEAVVATLRALEPDTPGLDDLLVAFRKMIDRQIEISSDALERRSKSPRPGRKQRTPVPRAFTTWYERLVLVAGEVETGQRPGGTVAEVVYWCAIRPAGGETFARFVRPSQVALKPDHVAHMGLSIDAIRAGSTPSQFRAQWRRFVRPDDIVAGWNRQSLPGTLPVTQSLFLKGIVCNLIGRGCGHLDDFVRDAGLTPVPTPFEGRAGRHMSGTLAVAAYLRRLGRA